MKKISKILYPLLLVALLTAACSPRPTGQTARQIQGTAYAQGLKKGMEEGIKAAHKTATARARLDATAAVEADVTPGTPNPTPADIEYLPVLHRNDVRLYQEMTTTGLWASLTPGTRVKEQVLIKPGAVIDVYREYAADGIFHQVKLAFWIDQKDYDPETGETLCVTHTHPGGSQRGDCHADGYPTPEPEFDQLMYLVEPGVPVTIIAESPTGTTPPMFQVVTDYLWIPAFGVEKIETEG